MTITFNKSEKFQNAKKALSEAMTNTDEAKQNEAFTNYIDVLQDEVTNSVMEEAQRQIADQSVLQNRGEHILTSEEMKFFNAVVNDGGFKDDSILPVTTQERVFEDLNREHPLLRALNIQNLNGMTKIITSKPELAYSWKPLFGDIGGQINAAFDEQTLGANKLTAFAAISNDMLELGPVWIERYVRTVLQESFSVGLEHGFVNGSGSTANEPIGLINDVDANGGVTPKTASGTLTFGFSQDGRLIASELHGVVSALSTDEEGKSRNINNRVVMVVNPVDSLAVRFASTFMTPTGVWVTSLPYNVEVVESDEVGAGKAVFFVRNDYMALVGGGYRFRRFDQTLALEDAVLYTVKQFADGKPKDNKTALLYNLDITTAPTGV